MLEYNKCPVKLLIFGTSMHHAAALYNPNKYIILTLGRNLLILFNTFTVLLSYCIHIGVFILIVLVEALCTVSFTQMQNVMKS